MRGGARAHRREHAVAERERVLALDRGEGVDARLQGVPRARLVCDDDVRPVPVLRQAHVGRVGVHVLRDVAGLDGRRLDLGPRAALEERGHALDQQQPPLPRPEEAHHLPGDRVRLGRDYAARAAAGAREVIAREAEDAEVRVGRQLRGHRAEVACAAPRPAG